MPALNEWELLVAEQDLEPGDTLVVLDIKTDKMYTDIMVLLKTTKSVKNLTKDNVIVLVDSKNKRHKFDTKTLEENVPKASKKRWFIMGRSSKELPVKRRKI